MPHVMVIKLWVSNIRGVDVSGIGLTTVVDQCIFFNPKSII